MMKQTNKLTHGGTVDPTEKLLKRFFLFLLHLRLVKKFSNYWVKAPASQV